MEDLILQEMRGMRTELASFMSEMRERVAVLEAHDHDISGNGQPGRMAKAEERLNAVQRWQWKLLGAGTGLGGAASLLGWLVSHVLAR